MTDSTSDESFRVTTCAGVPIVNPPAEIDFYNAPAFGEALELASTINATIVVDMTANQLCDSSGLRMLVMAHKQAQRVGGELRMVMTSAQVSQVFKSTGIDRVIKIFGTLAAAAASD